MAATGQVPASELREILIDKFSQEELKALCSDLDVDYAILPGEGKAGKARELVDYMRRRDRVPELVDRVKQLRPRVLEDDVPEVSREFLPTKHPTPEGPSPKPGKIRRRLQHEPDTTLRREGPSVRKIRMKWRSNRVIILVAAAIVIGLASLGLWVYKSFFPPPPHKLTIAVAYFSEGQNPAIPTDRATSDLIFDALEGIEKEDPQGIRVLRVDRVFVGENAAQQARQEGNRLGASIVIWGDRSTAGSYTKISAHFAILGSEEMERPITIEREAFIEAEKVRVGGREINTDAITDQGEFFFTFGLERDIAYFAAFTAGLINYRNEKYDLAIKELELARDNAPTLPALVGKEVVLFYLGNAYFASWRQAPNEQAALDKAITTWVESIQLDPTDTSPHFNLGIAYYNKGNLDRAIEHWMAVVRLDPKLVDAYINLGVVYTRQAKPDLALDLFNKALAIGGEDAAVHVSLGNLYYEQGNRGDAIAEWQKAVELDPTNASAHNSLGIAYREQGDLDRAITEYQMALDLEPDDVVILNNLGVAYRAQGKSHRAIVQYEKALELDSGYIPARLNLGILYYLQGKVDLALEEWEKARQTDPDNPQSYRILGAFYYDQGEYSKAIDEWQEALRLGEYDAKTYEDLGDAYLALEELDNSVTAYDKAISLNPRLILVCDKLAQVYVLQDEPQDAVIVQQRCVDANPATAAVHNNLGRTLYQLGQYEQARQAYETALSKDGTVVEAYEGLGLVYLKLEEWDKAQETLDAALRLAPARARTHFYLGNLYFAQDNYAKAVIAYQTALELDPELVEAQTNLVSATYNLGITQAEVDPVAAEEAVKKVIALDPSHAEAHFALGNLYLRQERWPEAIDAYKATLSIRSDFPEARNNLAIALYSQGVSLFESGDKIGAIDAWRETVEQDSDNVEALIGLGRAYYDEAHFDEAITSFQEALALDPDSVEAHFGSGNAYFEQQDWASAITQYQAALDLKPDFAEAQHNLAIAYFNLGFSQLQAGQPRLAAQFLMQAIYFDPENAQAYFVLGNAYFQQEQWDEATASFEAALELEPDFSDAQHNLSVAYFRRGVDRAEAGNTSEAIQDFQKVLEISEDPELRSRAEANIGVLHP